MSNILSELQDKIDVAGIGVTAINLFTDNMPDSPDNCISLISAPSQDPNEYVDTQYLTLDIWVRNQSTETADEILQSLRDLFHRAANWDLPNFHVYFSQAVGNIQNMGRDIQSRQLRKMTFKFTYWDTAIIS